MHRQVNSISGRLSLRPPQRESLEILDRLTEITPPRKAADIAAALSIIQAEYPKVTDFERDFPSLCFSLATGVGKTRLMGAFISYLHLAHGLNNFFVLAPNLTIYNKLIADFTPNTQKYVFKGIAEFATEQPEIITGDNYDQRVGGFEAWMRVKINIFNISKINSEVRGGKAPRIKRLSEYIGQSYFDYLAGLEDLVLLMDESHRYRASAGIRAINELKPILGLELTATPFVEVAGGAVPFKNVVYDYPLARAMADGFVKEPAVVTQKNFDPTQFSTEQLEKIKLEDGIRLHEATKVELETYARQAGRHVVKPFVLVIARDTAHARSLLVLLESEAFFEGRYRGRVIQVDSSTTQSGEEKEEIVERLIKVESPDEPTEIVIHVNMLKEGWDVNNLYTIIPLRAANARVLIEQSIGRGLRLPYGARTGVAAVDRLNIVAHDKFQEIVDEANRGTSPIRLQQLILDPVKDLAKTRTVISEPLLTQKITVTEVDGSTTPPFFQNEEERKIAQITVEVIKRHEALPAATYLERKEVQSVILREVAELYHAPVQQEFEAIVQPPDLPAVVAKTSALFVQQTISIPRIVVVPKGEVTTGFNAFKLDCSSVRLQPVEHDLLIKMLQTGKLDVLKSDGSTTPEARPEDYLVRSLMDYDDVSYDDHAELLYDLAGQMTAHIRSYLSDEEAVNVIRYHQQDLARNIHVQMQAHHWERAAAYEAKVSKGFVPLKPNAYTAEGAVRNFRLTVDDPASIRRYVFGEFTKCLYPVQKFDSDTERRFSVILEDDGQVTKWFKPVSGQFQIYYSKSDAYEPDFVIETKTTHFLCEPKRADQIGTDEVNAKKDAAVEWCSQATAHAKLHGTKPWHYLLIPHDAIKDNMTLAGLASQYCQASN
ncbi:MAG: DEAD/DEAH box helicase family protein [Verrucomicrobiaceae bacterium]|nr:DEAD/DEAH box helicase family protein [Verrucomicrobiaceae bacterium]